MANQPKKYKKFVATAATATLVASAIVPVASAASFSDIAGNTHADAIKSLADQGIVNGYADGTFKPNTEINRGQTVKLLGRWLETQGYDIPADWDTKQRFNDLPVTAEAELVKYAALVKDAGVFNGSNGNLNYNQPMQRQQMAVVLVRAIDTVLGVDLVEEYKAADFTTSVKDLEKAFAAENREAIVALEYAGITVVDNFRPADTVTRGQFASFLYRTIEGEVEVGVEKIVSVKAINETRYEVTFGKAIDADVAREIEKEPNRIIAYHGGQNANSSAAIKAETVTFNSTKKVATIVLEKAPETDVNYRIALMDGKDNTTAKVVYESSPQVLVKGAETPDVTVNADQDKLVIDFKQKMEETDELFEADSYSLHDDKGNEIAESLKEIVDIDSGKFADKIKKDKVEFKLVKNDVLEAGKTYKIKVKEADKILTDDGDQLSEKNQVIEFKTPSVDKARPVVKHATVSQAGDNGQITLVFDKDLDASVANLSKLIKVKTPTGTDIKVDDVQVVEDATDSGKGKKVVVTVDGELDKTITYTVDLPGNVVANAYFYNALNKAGNVKAQAQDDVAVSSVKAAFERDTKDDKKANLILAFNQNVKDEIYGKVEIKVSGKTYTLQDDAVVEYGANGKELKIKDVTSAFNLELENGKTYEIVVKAGAVKTDSENAPANREDLKTTVSSNVDVTAPKVERMELVSETEIVLTFDKEVKDLKAKDVKVAKGFLINRDGYAEALETAISDSNYITVSTSGKKVTIKTNRDDVKFNTGEQKIEIAANKFVGGNGVENDKITVSNATSGNEGITADYVFVDNAAPVMVGAKVISESSLEVTYSENILPVASESIEFASQFTFEGLELKNYGTVAGTVADNDNKATFTFEDKEGDALSVLKVGKNYPELKIKYAPKTGVEVKDSEANKAKTQTLIGASK